ncbi:MAG: Ig-like domain-containing protein [Candidatus Competibacteraceae bacterium]
MQVTDNGSPVESGTATITVNLTDVNEPPVANPQSVTTTEDTPITIMLTGSDPENQTLSFISTSPSQGVLSGIAPNLTYTPNANFSGSDSFTFTVSDGANTSAPATITITITAVDDPPVAVNDAATVNEDPGATAINILANDTDVDGGPISIASVTQPGKWYGGHYGWRHWLDLSTQSQLLQ